MLAAIAHLSGHARWSQLHKGRELSRSMATFAVWSEGSACFSGTNWIYKARWCTIG